MTTTHRRLAKRKAATKQRRGQSSETPEGRAAIAAMPDVNSALVVKSFSLLGGQDFTTLVAEMRHEIKKVEDGDFGSLEQMLAAQAIALDTLFARLAAHAHPNLGQFPIAVELYMRLALRAQSQCRATVETLAAIKNPPVLFARQAYVAGGHQQVNNNGQPVATARVENEIRQSKLLEHSHERMDIGATSAAGDCHPTLETVDAVHWAQDSGRHGDRQPKRLERRQSYRAARDGKNAPTTARSGRRSRVSNRI